MKNVAMIVIIISLILIAGCSTVQSVNPIPVSSSRPINEPVMVEEKGYSFIISVDQLKFDQSFSNSHMLNVYMTIKNTGSKALGITCISKITDYASVKTVGSGASTKLLYPDESQSVKNIILIQDKQYNALSKDSKLEINCMGMESPGKGWMNFDASWDVKPEDLK